MTEEEARIWLSERLSVPRGTFASLEQLLSILRRESASQNLISASTWNDVWARHIVDSAQLLPHVMGETIFDIGSGAGFPGLVLALLDPRPITLCEPRRQRAAFLSAAADELALSHATIRQARVERIDAPAFGTIVARAVASLDGLFAMAGHLANSDTIWVLPKGRSAHCELAAARETWHGDFRMVNSVTDPQASIVVATDVRRKAGGGRG